MIDAERIRELCEVLMRTTKVISITLPEAMLEEAKKLAAKENRTMSELVREALRRYEWAQWLQETQAYGAERAAAAGILTEDDVVRVIHEYRAERRAGEEKRHGQSRRAS
jgi:metal-responsive CopG/Arc/MetJ family transcriptional regulator